MLILVYTALLSGVLGQEYVRPSLKIKRLTAPHFVALKHPTFDLICEYEGNATMVSWYKGIREFFRFIPIGTPHFPVQRRAFAVKGIKQIEVVKCDVGYCHLKIGEVTPEATGSYRCDIERSIPPYDFETKSAYVLVEGFAPVPPVLEGVATHYTEGDKLDAFCRGEEKPGFDHRIQWFINNNEITRTISGDHLELKITRSLFTDEDTPSITVQCAEDKYDKMIHSNKMTAYWKVPENCKNMCIRESSNQFFIKFLSFIILLM